MVCRRIERSRRAAPAVALGLGLALAAGCRTEERRGGFSLDLGNTTTVTRDSIIWTTPPARTGGFEDIVLRSLEIAVLPTGLDPEAAARVRWVYRSVLESTLTPSYPIVVEPGPRTLVVEARLTDTIGMRPLRERFAAVGGDPGGRLDAIGLEVRFSRGEDGEVIAGLVSTRSSHVFRGALRGGMDATAIANAFLPLAARLRMALDRARASHWSSAGPGPGPAAVARGDPSRGWSRGR